MVTARVGGVASLSSNVHRVYRFIIYQSNRGGGGGTGFGGIPPPPGLYQNPYSPVSGDTSQLCEVVGGIILSPPRHHPGDTSQAVEIG